MIISFSRRETSTSNHADSKETGPKAEVSTITRLKLSLPGLTKKISLESSLCNKDQTSEKFSKDLLEPQMVLRRSLNSLMMTIWVISLLAPPILEQA